MADPNSAVRSKNTRYASARSPSLMPGLPEYYRTLRQSAGSACPLGTKKLLLDRNASALDHIGPLRDLGFHERLDVGERHTHRHASIGGDAFPDRRIGKRFLNLGIKLVDDRLRRGLRRPESEPDCMLVSWQS